MIIFGTLPIVVAGLLLKKYIESNFRSLYVVAWALIGFGAVMLAAEAFAWWRRNRQPAREIDQLHAGDAATMGLAQAWPWCRACPDRERRFRPGWWPACRARPRRGSPFCSRCRRSSPPRQFELVKARHELLASAESTGKLLLATAVAGVVGYAAIAWLLTYVRRHTTVVFVVYRWLLAGLLLWCLATGRLQPFDEPAPSALLGPTDEGGKARMRNPKIERLAVSSRGPRDAGALS